MTRSTPMAKYLVAININTRSPWAQRIDHFRARFDYKYRHSKQLFISLIPPVDLARKQRNDFFEYARELSEDFLYSLENMSSLNFRHMDLWQGRNSILYLKPDFNDDIFHFQEALDELARDFSHSYKSQTKDKKNLLAFLTIGRFYNREQIPHAIEQAGSELPLPLKLEPLGCSLFEKVDHDWKLYDDLYTFTADKGEQELLSALPDPSWSV